MASARWIGAGTALLAMALAAGCGATQTGAGTPAPAPTSAAAQATTPAPDPFEQVVAASEATLAAGSARFTMNMDMTVGAESFSLLTATGSTDFNRQASEMEMSFTEQAGAPAQTVRTVMAGGTLYQQPAGYDRWFSVDAAAMGMAQSDPADQIRQFRNAAKDVHDAGTSEVRGQTMRHYQLKLALPAAPADATAPLPPDGVPADLYIDDQGRIGKVETRTPAPDQATTVLTMDFLEYGVPVTAQAPDPGLVDPMPR
jgi:hypothetical protein